VELNIQFTNTQIEKIREQGFIYMCACPSQVSEQIANLRKLFKYQRNCITNSEALLDLKTHEMIADATSRAHDIMQQCLYDVLVHEGWDLETLEMPANLRQLLEHSLDNN
jgi:hypothetical protein